MEAQLTTTESVRIDKELLAKIRHISKKRGQTIAGYINVNLDKIVQRDWQKFDEKNRL
jgi:predicted DNA-binding protein